MTVISVAAVVNDAAVAVINDSAADLVIIAAVVNVTAVALYLCCCTCSNQCCCSCRLSTEVGFMNENKKKSTFDIVPDLTFSPTSGTWTFGFGPSIKAFRHVVVKIYTPENLEIQ